MTYLYCAKCRDRFEPDDDHAWIDVEYRQIDARNDLDEFALCPECYLQLIDEWDEPV